MTYVSMFCHSLQKYISLPCPCFTVLQDVLICKVVCMKKKSSYGQYVSLNGLAFDTYFKEYTYVAAPNKYRPVAYTL